MAVANIEIPEKLVSYATPKQEDTQLERNAMILYPYIHKGTISHGKAAEILGMFKMDLIALYGELGIPYIDLADAEIKEEMETIEYLKEVVA